MADTDVLLSELTEELNPSSGAIAYIVNTPLTPVDRKVTLLNMFKSSGGFEPLSANRTYYVRAAGGNDSNTGLVNDSGGAWLTLQHALDYISSHVNLNGYDITIVCTGTFTTGAKLWSPFIGNGIVTLSGGTIEVPSAGDTEQDTTGIYVSRAQITLSGVSFTGGSKLISKSIWANHGGNIVINGCYFSTRGDHIVATSNGTVTCIANYGIYPPLTGDTVMNHHIVLENGGVFNAEGTYSNPLTLTISLTSSPQFEGGFFRVTGRSVLGVRSTTFSGSEHASSGYNIFSGSYVYRRYDVGLLPTPTAGIHYFTDNSTLGEVYYIYPTYLYSDVVKTSSTVGSNLWSLLHLVPGITYRFEAVIYTTSNVAGGIKIATSATGGMFTSFFVDKMVTNGTAISYRARSTTDTADQVAITAVTDATVFLKGMFKTATSGTWAITFAQNASNGAASTALTGSYLRFAPVQYV